MKTTAKTLIIILICITFSCNKDDNNTTEPTFDIIGKWNYSKTSDIQNGQEVNIQNWQHSVGCNKDYMQFNANDTQIIGKYIFNSCSLVEDSFTWTKVGNTITTNELGNTYYEIITLTENSLKMKVENSMNDSFIGFIYLERAN
jgi:hypothetical protein